MAPWNFSLFDFPRYAIFLRGYQIRALCATDREIDDNFARRRLRIEFEQRNFELNEDELGIPLNAYYIYSE